MPVTIAGPALIYVRWSCTRCGHEGGMARTTVPIDIASSSDVRVFMEQSLRQKLVRKHMEKQGCIATPDDFVIERVNPHGDLTV